MRPDDDRLTDRQREALHKMRVLVINTAALNRNLSQSRGGRRAVAFQKARSVWPQAVRTSGGRLRRNRIVVVPEPPQVSLAHGMVKLTGPAMGPLPASLTARTRIRYSRLPSLTPIWREVLPRHPLGWWDQSPQPNSFLMRTLIRYPSKGGQPSSSGALHET